MARNTRNLRIPENYNLRQEIATVDEVEKENSNSNLQITQRIIANYNIYLKKE